MPIRSLAFPLSIPRDAGAMRAIVNGLKFQTDPLPNCLMWTRLHVDVAACLREGPAVRRDAPAPASKALHWSK